MEKGSASGLGGREAGQTAPGGKGQEPCVWGLLPLEEKQNAEFQLS